MWLVGHPLGQGSLGNVDHWNIKPFMAYLGRGSSEFCDPQIQSENSTCVFSKFKLQYCHGVKGYCSSSVTLPHHVFSGPGKCLRSSLSMPIGSIKLTLTDT